MPICFEAATIHQRTETNFVVVVFCNKITLCCMWLWVQNAIISTIYRDLVSSHYFIFSPKLAYRLWGQIYQNDKELMLVVEVFSWWRHQMETFSASLALCAGNSPVSGEFPTQRSVMRSFGIDLRLINGWVNNREAGDLRRRRVHYDVIVMLYREGIDVLPRQWVRCVKSQGDFIQNHEYAVFHNNAKDLLKVLMGELWGLWDVFCENLGDRIIKAQHGVWHY